MISPQECCPHHGNPHCYFCQRSVEGAGALKPARVRWQGVATNTMICGDCRKLYRVPDKYPAAFRLCYFCGYPGGELRLVDCRFMTSPPVQTVLRHRKVVKREPSSGTYSVCEQCHSLCHQLATFTPDGS